MADVTRVQCLTAGEVLPSRLQGQNQIEVNVIASPVPEERGH